MAIGTAPVFALLVGGFHTALFLYLRGHGGPENLILFAAAVLGAWAGDATGSRLDIDPIRIGDFHLVSASVVAWAGILFVEVLSILGPSHASDRRL